MALTNADYLHQCLMLAAAPTAEVCTMDLWDKLLTSRGVTGGTVLERLTRFAATFGVDVKKFLEGDPATLVACSLHRSPNLIGNTAFGDATFWVPGTGWTIAAGVATHTAGNTASLSQPVNGVVAATYGTYRTAFDVANWTAGTVKIELFDGSSVVASGTVRGANGTYIEYITATAPFTTVRFTPSSDFAGDLDNTSFRRVLFI